MSNESLFFTDEAAEADNDPVVSEMPVYLNNHAGDSLVVLQYPTRKAGETNSTTRLSLKPNAQILETTIDPQLPMQFIDSSSAANRLTQKYSGVLNNTQAHFAVGVVRDNAFYINLAPKTGQLRPEFPAKAPLLNPAMLQANRAPAEAANLRSVQMSVKSTSQEVPKHSVALEFWRQANKEEHVPLQLRELTDQQKEELLATQTEGSLELETDQLSALSAAEYS